MERWVGRVALVTGASRGIGAAIVRALVKKGMKVVGCARTLEDIEAIADEVKSEPGSLLPIRCDMRNTDQIKEMFKTIKSNSDLGGVDVCINNAGMALDAPLGNGDEEKWRAMLEVNVLGLSVCTREAIKSMRERKVDDGHILHLNSMSGHRVVPVAASHFYSSTKYAVTALTEGLRQELRAMKTNIRVTSVSPGVVDTNFINVLYEKDAEKHAKAHAKEMDQLLASDIADAVVYALGAPAHVQVHELMIRPTKQVL